MLPRESAFLKSECKSTDNFRNCQISKEEIHLFNSYLTIKDHFIDKNSVFSLLYYIKDQYSMLRFIFSFFYAKLHLTEKSRQILENSYFCSFTPYTRVKEIPREEKIFPSGNRKKNIAIYGYFPRDVQKTQFKNNLTKQNRAIEFSRTLWLLTYNILF